MKKIIYPIYRKIVFDNIAILKKLLFGCDSVLDLGCGKRSPIQYCQIPYSVGVDLYEPYLEETKMKKIHNEYIKNDIRHIDFGKRKFDSVIALGIIEHMQKQEGYNLMAKMESLANKNIIISTPNEFVERDERNGNMLEKHVCGWRLEELKKLGFKVFGTKGLKWLRKHTGEIKYKPVFFWERISDLTQIFVYHFPRLAFDFVAVKKVKNKGI